MNRPVLFGGALMLAGGLVVFAQGFAGNDDVEIPTSPPRPPVTGPIPSGYRRMTSAEVSPELSAAAYQVLASHASDPYGTVVYLGDGYAAMVEEHWHPPGGAATPWGFHTGVSLLTSA